MKPRLPLACAAALLSVSALTACGPSNPDPSSVTEAAQPVPAKETTASMNATEDATTEPSASPTSIYGERIVSDRGNLVKKIGQLAGLSGENPNDVIAEFKITSIETDVKCTEEFAQPSENGHFIAITMEVQTTPKLAEQSFSNAVYFTPVDFKVIGPDGSRENDSLGNSFSCLPDAELLPGEIGPSETATGKIVLDSAYTEGVLVFNPMFDTGWEWEF